MLVRKSLLNPPEVLYINRKIFRNEKGNLFYLKIDQHKYAKID